MSSTPSGLTRRRGGGGGTGDTDESGSPSRVLSPGPQRPEPRQRDVSYDNVNGHKVAYDPRDISENEERVKQPKLTLMEDVLLLGLKDKQVYISAHFSAYLVLTSSRACYHSGTTTSRMPSEGV